ncbi:hypothetical protein [Thermaerobacillus caldiproteolyticus]|uniref:hypothetical protein n=1 Tax=Thermaerobacillus caldiproteolyticus TaxID=247480 RepID=UPI0018F1E1A9|nr:hypothetical protein [Anoxybacillus caldiproteolyticus]
MIRIHIHFYEMLPCIENNFMVFNGNVPQKSVICHYYTKDDSPELIRIQQESFPPSFPQNYGGMKSGR